MPDMLPAGVEISVSRRSLPADYRMPTMDMSVDHYSIGFLIAGDRRTITPQQSYDAHAGDVSMLPPFLYHRTVSLSDTPYESYLVKFTAKAVEPLVQLLGSTFLDELTEQKIHHFREDAQERLQWLFEEMRGVYESGAPYSSIILQGLLLRLLTLVREEHTGSGAEYFPSELSNVIVDVLVRIEQQYAENLRLSDLAGEFGYSTAHLSRLFSRQLGVSFSEYLSRVRMRHVCRLLSGTDRSVSEIALSCGYCSGDYLATRFQARMGMTPLQFRKAAPPFSAEAVRPAQPPYRTQTAE